ALVPAARRLPSPKALRVSCAYAATVTLFVLATKFTTAANAIFIQDTAPLYVLLLSPWLLGEKPSRGELLAVPVFLAGLGLFFLDQLAPGQMDGNLLALASGVAFALSIMGLRAVNAEGPSVLAVGNLIAAAVSLPGSIGGPSPEARDLLILLFLGVFQLALAYVLFNRGLEKVPAVEGSLLILIEPVLNPLWAFLFAGEEPGRFAVYGGALILAATAWRTLAGARPRVPAAA
ncbi:MAG: DMT family transporter, partial [Myxococcales bacterium]